MSRSSTPRSQLTALVLLATLVVVPDVVAAQRQESPLDVKGLALSSRTKPFSEFSNSAVTLRDSLVAVAKAQIGKRYRFGGASPDRGFDCSGLVKYVLEALQLDVPRTSKEQSRIGAAIPRDTTQLRPGDLLLFGQPKAGVSHVGIYVGNGRFVHASSTAGRVIESPLDRPPSTLIKVFKSARRILDGEGTATATLIAARRQ